MAGNEKFGLKEVLDVTLYDMGTGRPVIQFDSLKNTSINVTAEKVSARGGRGNPKLITWEFNKEATMTIEDALLSPKSFALISGIDTVTGTKNIPFRQTTVYKPDAENKYMVDQGELDPLVVVDSDGAKTVTLAFTPVELNKFSPDVDVLLYRIDDDCGTPLKTTYTGRTVTISDEIEAGTRVVAYYTIATPNTTQSFTIDAKTFASTYKLVGDTVVRNKETGKDETFKVIIPNIKWSSNFTFNLTAEGEPSSQSFECDILKPSDSYTLIEMYKYDQSMMAVPTT